MNASDLSAILHGGGGRDEEAMKHPMDPVAQAMELRDRYKRYKRKRDSRLKPGALCREQRGMTTNRLNPLLMMFWRWLDIKDPQDRMLIEDGINDRMINRIDCMTGYISERGNLILVPTESWRLEVVEDET